MSNYDTSDNRYIPVRMCISCRKRENKDKLIRIVYADNKFFCNNSHIFGRGAYVCNKSECIDKLIEKKLLNKVYKTNILNEVYDSLKEAH